MRNFSAVYKKKFKQMLQPYGYSNWKSVFLKLEDNVYFTICAKGKFNRERSAVWTFLSPFPYFQNVTQEDFDQRGFMDNMLFILQRIAPEKFTMEHYISLIRATSEEDTLRNLDSICEVIEEFVLPYIHRFTDLEYYYNEIQIMKDWNAPPIGLSDDELFLLLIKIRKYENALIHTDHQIEHYLNHIKRMRVEIDESRIKENYSSKENILISESYEGYRSSRENAIVTYEKRISDIQITKDALLSNDHTYFDNYIKEIEYTSRAYLRDMLTS